MPSAVVIIGVRLASATAVAAVGANAIRHTQSSVRAAMREAAACKCKRRLENKLIAPSTF